MIQAPQYMRCFDEDHPTMSERFKKSKQKNLDRYVGKEVKEKKMNNITLIDQERSIS